MKLKCNDGKVREFQIALNDGDYFSDGTRNNQGDIDAYCIGCYYNFGCHDTKILKPKFKSHTCLKKA